MFSRLLLKKLAYVPVKSKLPVTTVRQLPVMSYRNFATEPEKKKSGSQSAYYNRLKGM